MEAEQSEGQKNRADHRTARLETLTDGVFAIAMTLLVLAIQVPPIQLSAETDLVVRLTGMWPHFLNYALSFLLLAAFWVGHHMQFDLIERTDRGLLWLNVLGLMFVAILPFSTSLMSEHHGVLVATLFFETNLLIIGLVSAYQWSYAVDNELLKDDVTANAVRSVRWRTLIVPFASLIAMAIAFGSPKWSGAIYFAIPLLFLFRWRGER